MYDNILIPVDGTDESEKALDHGLGLASAFDATVHALYVIDLPGAPRTLYVRDDEEEIRQEYRNYGEAVTGDAADAAAEADLDAVTAIRSGSPHEEIVDYADEEGADLIVMGTAYRGKMGALLGSTTERVVRTATVPVTTLRMQVDEFPGAE